LRQKKIPLRMCTGCGQMKPKRELVRVVKSPEGEVSLDTGGRKPGRGAYVCPDAACLKAARKARRFERAFQGPIPAEVWERLEQELPAVAPSSGTPSAAPPRADSHANPRDKEAAPDDA